MRRDSVRLLGANEPTKAVTTRDRPTAKITVPMLPQAREEYDQSQMAQLIQTLEQMIFILNNTYTPVTLSDEDEQKSWFLS